MSTPYHLRFADYCQSMAKAFSRLESIMRHESEGDEDTATAAIADLNNGVPIPIILAKYGLLDE